MSASVASGDSSSNVRGRGIGGRWHSEGSAELNMTYNRLRTATSNYYASGAAADDSKTDADMANAHMDQMKKIALGVSRYTEEDRQEFMKGGQVNPGVTNIYRELTDYLKKLKVFCYRVDFTDPAIPPTSKSERRRELMGGGHSQMIAKKEHLNVLFGQNSWSFDTQLIWALNKPEQDQITIAKGQFGNRSTINITFTGENALSEVPKVEAQRLLNICVVRPAFRNSKEKWMSVETPAGIKWFNMTNAKTETIARHQGEPALTVTFGVMAKIVTAQDFNNSVYFGFQVQEATRLQLTDNLDVLLKKARSRGGNWQQDQAALWEGRVVYLTYAGQRKVIVGKLRFDLNETYKLSNSNMTIKQYYRQKHNINIRDGQVCLIEQKYQTDTFFVPELCVLSAKSDDAPNNYGEMLERTSKAPYERFSHLTSFVENFNASIANTPSLRGKLTFSLNPEKISFIPLDVPKAFCKGKNGQKTEFQLTDMPGCWGRSTGGPFEPTCLPKNPLVLCQAETEIAASTIVSLYQRYSGMRKLPEMKNNPPTEKTIPLDFNYDKPAKYAEYAKVPNDCIIAVVPEGVFGSQLKTILQSEIQYPRVMTGKDTPKLQCILAPSIGASKKQQNAVLGMMGNLVLKFGNKLYTLELKNNKTFSGSDWVLGISVNHSGARKPSTICAHLDMSPLTCNVTETRASCILIPEKQQVASGRRFEKVINDLLMKFMETHGTDSSQLASKLPKTVTVLRDGLADDQRDEFYKEEALAIKKAFAKFAADQKLTWKPQILILICTKQGMSDLCPADRSGKLVAAKLQTPTLVVDPNCLAADAVEFLININPKDRRAKPKRYICVMDDAGVMATVAGMKDLGEYLNALSWTYAYALPFSTGNPGLPCQVKMASKYAELMSQFITTKDKDLKRFYASTTNWRPTIVEEE